MRRIILTLSILLGLSGSTGYGALYEPTPTNLLQARESARSEADLVAQETVAKWAAPTFAVSLFSAMISAGALVGLYFSLQQTRTALTDNRELGEAGLRSYVDVQDVEFSSDGQAIIVRLANTGQTPALGLRVSVRLARVPKGEVSTNVEMLGRSDMKTFSGMGCGDLSTREVRVEPLAGREHIREFTNNIPPKGEMCLVLGRVEYLDVFSKVWATGFAFYRAGERDHMTPSSASLFLKPRHKLPTHELVADGWK